MAKIVRSLFGDPHERRVKEYWPMVETINSLEANYVNLTDQELQAQTQIFKERLQQGETLDALLPEAFSVVREAAKRTLGFRHFDVQLIGGIVLHQGKISEMKTGEGKTLVSTLPAYLNALEGKGVYIVTVNDYLAKRDSQWMGQIFRFLGLSVGLIQNNMRSEERLKAYECDITYGTNNEFGFDYLRDHLALDKSQCCQTRRHFAIVDEVDSILIDEARTPLIISGAVEHSTAVYGRVAGVVRSLEKDADFKLDEKHKNVVLSESGVAKLEKMLGIENLYEVEHMEVPHIAVQCLRALHLYKNEVDYVIKDQEVVIVDEFTGRLMEGRRYSDGLHQAIEAIEGLTVREESQTLATITFQNFFRMFPKLSGMTGTAITEEAEFGKIYNLEVVVIPPNRTVSRVDYPDLVFKTKAEKYRAIVNEIKELHSKKQPVLVGTISIETSELLSKMLTKQNIPHSVLNAKYHEREADIIAKAGQAGTVTIATNMAGRGTDIVLGDGVAELGGLFVIGTERHESRRIDNQLRGRSGRQGDPGGSRFYVSLEDELMRLFGSDRIIKIMDTLGMPDDMPIEHGMVTKSIERAQTKVEKYHFGVRKQILEYDDVMNRQRESVYSMRRQILSGENLDSRVGELINKVTDAALKSVPGGQSNRGGSTTQEDVTNYLSAIFPIENLGDLVTKALATPTPASVINDGLWAFYQFRKNQTNPVLFEDLVTKRVLLTTLDRKWIDHLHNMDILREGIGLRAWGQREPLVEYKIEAFEMYETLLLSFSEESLTMIGRSVLISELAVPNGEQSPFVDLDRLTGGNLI
ncbi:preprotein translocase subunit SecA [bacterium]|nr:preprotein translocase subunit SecA [bacterium]